MASALSDKLSRLVKEMRGQARITESNVQDMLREVRMALLEADVALPVVRDFIARVKEKALGQEVAGSLNPGQARVRVSRLPDVALGAHHQPGVGDGGAEQAVGSDAQGPVQGEPGRGRDVQRRAGEYKGQQHRRGAQAGQGPSRAQLREHLALDGIDREHQPGGDGQGRREAKARCIAQ